MVVKWLLLKIPDLGIILAGGLGKMVIFQIEIKNNYNTIAQDLRSSILTEKMKVTIKTDLYDELNEYSQQRLYVAAMPPPPASSQCLTDDFQYYGCCLLRFVFRTCNCCEKKTSSSNLEESNIIDTPTPH